MISRALHNKLGRPFRLGLSGVAGVAMATTGALVLTASPATAGPSIQVYAQPDQTWTTFPPSGVDPNFSYMLPFWLPMGRDIDASAGPLTPGANVSFSWQDQTTNSAWVNVGSSSAGSAGFADELITNIPATDCGQTIAVDAVSGSASGSTTYVEDCGPELWTAYGGGEAGVEGDGFTPGGQVTISFFWPNGASISSQTVTATVPEVLSGCSYSVFDRKCWLTLVRSGGEVSLVPGGPLPLAYYAVAHDLTTGLSAETYDWGS
jgi:hypothetical protein